MRKRECHGDMSDQCPHDMIFCRLFLLNMADAHTRVDTSCYTVYSVIVCTGLYDYPGDFRIRHLRFSKIRLRFAFVKSVWGAHGGPVSKGKKWKSRMEQE